MSNRILGIHHITAIAGSAKRNHDFYTQVLGLRMVKKTVNFDDPGTYHFYFGDEVGSPGTILTFFPWERVKQGHHGAGMATDIGYAVPAGSLDFWKERFNAKGVKVLESGKLLGDDFIRFQDPDGLVLTLLVPSTTDDRKGYASAEVSSDRALKGFHSIALTVRNIAPTARVLTDIFGYTLQGREGKRSRYITDAIPTAAVVDLIEDPAAVTGLNAGGTIHHVAFRVKDDNVLMEYREKVLAAGLQITPKIDRNYFFSLYFREPGGVLFEIATDNPGFMVDEELSRLGTGLKLPPQYESQRERIEKHLPTL